MSTTVDRVAKLSRQYERACIVQHLRDVASKQTTYDKIDLLNQIASELEGTEFVPDGKLGSDYKGVTE